MKPEELHSGDDETAALCQQPEHSQTNMDDSSHHDAHHQDSSNDTPESDDDHEEARKIALQETYMVRLWRFVTTDVMIMVTCTVVLSAYAILRALEYEEFQEAYELSSEALAAALGKVQAQNVAALAGLAASLGSSSSSASNNSSDYWAPYQPADFEVKAGVVHQLSGIEQVYYAPLVSEANKEAYLTYVDRLHLEAHQENTKPWHASRHSNEEANVQTRTFQEEYSQEFYFPTLDSYPPPPGDEGHPTIHWDLTDLITNSTSFLDDLALLGSNQSLLIPPKDDDSRSYMLRPIRHPDSTDIVGLLAGGVSLTSLVQSVRTTHSSGLVVVVTSCQGSFTFRIEGADAVVQSTGDLHDEHYEDYEVIVDMGLGGTLATQCQAQMSIYPSRELELEYRTCFPEVFTLVLAIAFALVAAAFFRYDVLVDRRNEKLIDKFSRSNAIISSLFPKNFRDRLMGESDDGSTDSQFSKSQAGKLKSLMSREGRLTNNGSSNKTEADPSKPLADIFPEVSIIFADIAGFTAWSSSREPHQVFTLLETLYCGFDEVAKRRRVFKVETIGDCYVAASGLPNSQPDHAVRMVRFGRDIIHKMHVLTRELEVVLGPDTGDLNLRAGIHSGTVTAGILRGQKARFQLFGDTMNTASRIESNGMPGRIQVSQATADRIVEAGHEQWLQKRPEKIAAKGKGLMQTYWVTRNVASNNSIGSLSTLGAWDQDSLHDDELDAKWQWSDTIPSSSGSMGMSDQLQLELKLCEQNERVERLVEWNVATLGRLIKKIIAHRQAHNEVTEKEAADLSACLLDQSQSAKSRYPLDEVKEIITLPEFTKAKKGKINPSSIELPTKVMEQLQSLVGVIGRSYRNNHFHNFEHGSHVVMSVAKLLSRIVDPRDDDSPDGKAAHDHTYGITSDPLTQFACAFSALIHDADHEGVPNAQLAKEETELALRYNNISVAEQHSLDLSWEVFMSSEYDELRSAICATPSELKRFREIVVNAVMATDIANKDLKAQRNARWEKAFAIAEGACGSDQGDDTSNPRDAINRKATIVIEHLMQASDVAHTMQHWHVYRKWNERLLREVYKAYKEGRQEHNPLVGWYQGEIGFFDFYIIPLAKKLQECGVFGVSSDEYLTYALNNRDEWEERGKEVVAAVAASLEEEYRDHRAVQGTGSTAIDLE